MERKRKGNCREEGSGGRRAPAVEIEIARMGANGGRVCKKGRDGGRKVGRKVDR